MQTAGDWGNLLSKQSKGGFCTATPSFQPISPGNSQKLLAITHYPFSEDPSLVTIQRFLIPINQLFYSRWPFIQVTATQSAWQAIDNTPYDPNTQTHI